MDSFLLSLVIYPDRIVIRLRFPIKIFPVVKILQKKRMIGLTNIDRRSVLYLFVVVYLNYRELITQNLFILVQNISHHFLLLFLVQNNSK